MHCFDRWYRGCEGPLRHATTRVNGYGSVDEELLTQSGRSPSCTGTAFWLSRYVTNYRICERADRMFQLLPQRCFRAISARKLAYSIVDGSGELLEFNVMIAINTPENMHKPVLEFMQRYLPIQVLQEVLLNL